MYSFPVKYRPPKIAPVTYLLILRKRPADFSFFPPPRHGARRRVSHDFEPSRGEQKRGITVGTRLKDTNRCRGGEEARVRRTFSVARKNILETVCPSASLPLRNVKFQLPPVFRIVSSNESVYDALRSCVGLRPDV